MKRLMVFTACLSLVALAPVYAAEIYWDTPPGDAEITDQDFKYEYQGLKPAKSLRELDVYFNPGDPPPDWATDLYESEQPPAAPAQARISDTPRPRVTAPAVPETDRRGPTVAPRPAETSPGSTQSIILPPPEPSAAAQKKKPQTKRAQRDAPGTQAVEKPESKKLQWGQTETKTSEEKDKGKFQWGQPK
jgi:hypothetical protein